MNEVTPQGASADEIIKRLQTWMRDVKVIVLGSGASADYGYPLMGQLATHLLTTIAPSPGDEPQWASVRKLLESGVDLETALTGDHCGPALSDQIVSETWRHVSKHDLIFYRLISSESTDFPLAKLVKWFNTSTRKIDFITTNYDRVIEYACDVAHMTWLDGTGFGHFRRGMRGFNTILQEGQNGSRLPISCIWKVHGSLDWFSDEKAAFTTWVLQSQIPDRARPLIVTPGRDKYERTYEDPFRTIIAGADRVMQGANSFLCVGYGFNDKHIHTKLIEKSQDSRVRFIVAARCLTDSTKRFLREGGCKSYIAVEKGADGQSLIWAPDLVDPISVQGNLWSIGGIYQTVT